MAMTTEEELQKIKDSCTHEGKHGPVAQTIINGGKSILIVTSHNCANCGHVFNELLPVNIAPDPSKIKTLEPDFGTAN